MRESSSAKHRVGETSQLGEELVRLALPPLTGTSFLEIGCREGFFCGFAWFEGARNIIGLGTEGRALMHARERFPFCRFSSVAGNLAKVLTREGGFDVILCSALPRPVDMPSLLPLLMTGLTRTGVLILKQPMKEVPAVAGMSLLEAARCLRGPQPADPAMVTALEPYVYKVMGESAVPGEDGTSQCIVHVRHKAPYAILLLGEPGSGKTTITRKVFGGFPVIHGDSLLSRMATLPPGSLRESYPQLDAICAGPQNTMGVGGIMIQIFNSAAGKQYARLVAELAGGKDFVYEGVIHKNFRHVFMRQLEMLGYAVVALDTPAPENTPRDLFRKAREEERKYRLYLESRRRCGD